jgi:hypothetical protein
MLLLEYVRRQRLEGAARGGFSVSAHPKLTFKAKYSHAVMTEASDFALASVYDC